MVESVIALFFVLVIFLFMVDLLQAMKAKILVEYAAAKCARARSVGYNDFMLTKIARLATMPAAGKCKTRDEEGVVISRSAATHKMGAYLNSGYEAQADQILDFDFWNSTFVDTKLDSSGIEVTVLQRRQIPFFDSVFKLLGEKNRPNADSPFELPVKGCSKIGTHYLDYLSP